MKKNSVRRWIILCFTAILVLSMAASAVANYHEATSRAMRQGEVFAELCADNIQNLLLYQWDFDSLNEDDGTELYRRAREMLHHFCTCYKLDYLYVYSIDTKTPSRTYLACAAADREQDRVMQDEVARRTVPAEHLLAGEAALLAGEKDFQRETPQNSHDGDIIWLVPYADKNGVLRAIIRIDYSLAEIRNTARHNFLMDIIPFFLSLSVGLLILLVLVQRRIVSPIAGISKSMRLFAQDSRKKPEPLKIPPLDEIEEIAAAYEKMTADISDYVNNIEALTREQVETNVQFELARRIQYGLVPAQTTLDGKNFCVCAMTQPAKAVGGDFYDCFQRDDNSVCIVMGDVSGKGITAAIFMAMIKTVIREKLIAGLSPAETLNQTNDELCVQNPENLFVTAFLAVLDPVGGELCYANAGHTYPMLLKEEPEFLIPESGIVLGMFENAGIENHTITLTPGEGILLYTDGVTEAVNPERRFFGEQRLLEALKEYRNDVENAESVILRVSRAVHDFCAGSEPFDDMAVLALIRKEIKRGWRKIPVALSSFDEIKKEVFAVIGETPEARRALLACDEALTNIVHYSEATNLSFLCDKQNDRLRVAFSDDGIPFDPTAVPLEEKEFDVLDSGGMGLSLIRQTASSAHYEWKNDRNILSLFFSLQEGPDSSQYHDRNLTESKTE